jgi:MFS family permease
MRQTAFAIDSVLIELCFTLGPALVAVLVATVSARAAHVLAWAFVAASVPLLHLSGALQWWKTAPAIERHLLGPLRERELLILFAAQFALTIAFGALEVGYPAFGLEWNAAAWGPALIAINSIGSAIGGLAYGAIHTSLPVEKQLPRLLAAFSLPIALHLLAGGPWSMVGLAFVAGLLIAPSMTGMMMIVSRHAPPAYATEAFTWSSTAIVTGLGAGMAAAGALVERFGAKSAIVLCAASALLSALLSLALRKR